MNLCDLCNRTHDEPTYDSWTFEPEDLADVIMAIQHASHTTEPNYEFVASILRNGLFLTSEYITPENDVSDVNFPEVYDVLIQISDAYDAIGHGR